MATVGTGYLGLVAGAGQADSGLHVSILDSQCEKVEAPNRAETTIAKPGDGKRTRISCVAFGGIGQHSAGLATRDHILAMQ
jgi:UDP-N-acetyl-D-mannosaminuronate dehydrogenase